MKSSKTIPTLIAALLLSVPAWAQQSAQQQTGGAATPVQPISSQPNAGNSSGAVPAARGLFVGSPEDNGAIQTGPDDHLLSGAESFSLGALHSFTTLFDPSVFVTESTDNGIEPGQWSTATSLGGSLAFVRDWAHTQITTQYSGAESFYRPDSQSDGSYQNLSLSQAMHAGRWGLVLRDNLIFTQGSNFGGFQTGGVAPSGGVAAGSTLQPGIAPAESIATGQVSTLNNTTVAQGSYSVSRRTAITFAGAYGILHFDEPGYIDSDTISGIFGYNYALSRMNSLAGLYSFSQDNYNGAIAKASSHTMQGAFGRKITGRLALQLAAGPQVVISQNSFGTQSGSQWSWAANGAVTYGPRPKHFSYTAAYSHGLTSGSGVFYGAESDNVTGTVQASIGRSWSGSINAGFGSNRSLAGAGFGATRYDNWYSGANINRSIGRQLLFSLTYQYSNQTSNGSCPVVSCGATPSREAVYVRMQWHPWPARIQ